MSELSQTQTVIRAIEQMIVDGEYGPGDRLPIESSLADRIGVSRGSLREGVRALAARGVLVTRQGSGTTVSSLEPRLLLDPLAFWTGLQEGDSAGHVHQARRAVEVEAAGIAARTIGAAELAELRQILGDAEPAIQARDHEQALAADLRFHQTIAAATNNPVLAALIEALSGPTLRTRLWQSVHRAGRLAATHAEHLGILDALESRDPVAARAAMLTHLAQVANHLPHAPEPEEAEEAD